MTEPESPSAPAAWTPPPAQPWAPPTATPGQPGWAPAGPVWPQPGTPQAVFGPGFFPPPAPPRRRRGNRLGIAVLGVLVLALLVGGGVVTVRAIGRNIAGPGGSGSPTPSPVSTSSAPAPVPTTNFDVALTAQSKAMVAGDETGWMAAIDPHASAAVAEYKRIFHNLRQMKVAAWQEAPLYNDLPVVDTPRTFWIDIQYCLITAPCTMLNATVTVTAQLRDGLVQIETFDIPVRNASSNQPLPWLVANLSAAVDPVARVVVAASSAEAGHLTTALHSAASTAKTADTFAHWGKPDIYLTYLASVTEAKLWFGSTTNVAKFTAVTNAVSSTDIENVLIFPGAIDGGLGLFAATMRWANGLSALDHGSGGVGSNSLGNGMADYIASAGFPGWTSNDVSSARSWIRTGKWNKSVYLTTEMQSSSDKTRWGADSIGYLAMRHLIQRFGLSKALDFWGDVERQNQSLDEASTAAFGLPWKSVNGDCVNYIEHLI